MTRLVIVLTRNPLFSCRFRVVSETVRSTCGVSQSNSKVVNAEFLVLVCDFRSGELLSITYEYGMWNSESTNDVLP